MASSFDPLALVKAMGQQTDPFSWARQYGADALKMQMFQEQQARLEQQREDTLNERREGRAERSKDRAHDREVRLSTAQAQEAGRMERARLRLEDRNENRATTGVMQLAVKGIIPVSPEQYKQLQISDPARAARLLPYPLGRQVYYVERYPDQEGVQQPSTPAEQRPFE